MYKVSASGLIDNDTENGFSNKVQIPVKTAYIHIKLMPFKKV